PFAHPRPRRLGHGRDLGQGLVGPLVGVGRADARLVSDRVPPVRHLPAPALLDRGPGAPGPLRLRLRDHRRRLRPAQLPGRPVGPVVDTPAGAQRHRRIDAGLEAPPVPGLAGRDDAAVRDAVEVRAGLQARARAAALAAAHAGRPGGLSVSALPFAAPALPLDEAGKYVAGAYVVFIALILIYVAIMAARLGRIERELGELEELASRRQEDERTKE